MNAMSHTDSALNSIVIRVAIPTSDVSKVILAADDLDVTILTMEASRDDSLVFMELYLKSAFNLYALGKMVAYNEFLNDKK